MRQLQFFGMGVCPREPMSMNSENSLSYPERSSSTRLSVPFMRRSMGLIPAPFLARMTEILMRGIAQRHPKLFENLARLSPTIIHIEPTDLRHHFALSFGDKPAALSILGGAHHTPAPTATICGTFEMLLDLLEGRIDGDTVFFSRDLKITGDTAAIVALRNTLDREELDVSEEINAVLGPMATPLIRISHMLDRAAVMIKRRRAA